MSVGTTELAAVMPNAGLDWKRIFGNSGTIITYFTANYVGQWESLLARWQSDDVGLLQPEMACPCYWAGCMLLFSGYAAVGKREVELTSQSEASTGYYATGQSSVADRFADGNIGTNAQT